MQGLYLHGKENVIMVKKVYAVKKGRITGIFSTWDECKRQVDGFKSAEYKSFTNKEDAEKYLNSDVAKILPIGTDANQQDKYNDDTAVAYVDGSYRADTKEFSCGAILFYMGEEIYFSKKFEDRELAEMRNVAGEILGSVSVISHCIEKEIKKLVIYYDYEGVEKWATGSWKANKKGTIEYKAFCEAAREKLEFSFVKVKGHSGDKYNDMADALAKKALGL